MNSASDYELGSLASPFIRDSMEQGLLVSRLALERCSGHRADAWAVLEEGLDPLQLSTPGFGGVAGTMSAVDIAPEVVRQARSIGGRHPVLVVEDEVARPTDAMLERLSIPWMGVGDEVFHYVALASASDDLLVRMLVRGTNNYPGNAYILDAHVPFAEACERGELPGPVLLGMHVAYDSEGWVLWKPLLS